MQAPHSAQPLTSLPATTDLAQAARVLEENRIGCILVTDDEGRALGVVTDRDLALRAVAHGLVASETTLEQVLSQPLLGIGVEDHPMAAIDVMRRLGVRRVPVLREEEPADLIAMDDMLVHLSGVLADLTSVVEPTTLPRHGPLEELESFVQQARERMASLAWRSEAAVFDELEQLRDRIAEALGLGSKLQGPQ